MRTGSCYYCGAPMRVDEHEVAHHVTEDGVIDYDKDADHVALRDQDMTNPPPLKGEKKVVFQATVAMRRWTSLPHAHTDVGHTIARVLGVAPFYVRAREQRYHQLLILVPAPQRRLPYLGLSVTPGSAIVGQLHRPFSQAETLIEVYYEGAIYATSPVSFEDKLFQAASRMIEQYPTSARAWVDANHVVPVGVYAVREDYEEQRMWIWEQNLFDDWLAKKI